MQRVVDLLNKYGHQLNDWTQSQLEAMPVQWNALKTRVSLAKQQLGPKIQDESETITKVFFILYYIKSNTGQDFSLRAQF